MVADHDDAVVAKEAALVVVARMRVEAGVVGQRLMPWRTSNSAVVLHLLARQAIDDAGLARMLVVDEPQQLPAGIVLLDDAVTDVGPVEAGDESRGAAQTQPFDDLLRVGASAVAVSAMRGTPAKRSASTASCRYSGRKS